MDEILTAPWFRPAAGVVFAFAVILVVAQLLRRAIGRYVGDVDARYRARKAVSFAMIVAITTSTLQLTTEQGVRVDVRAPPDLG